MVSCSLWLYCSSETNESNWSYCGVVVFKNFLYILCNDVY